MWRQEKRNSMVLNKITIDKDIRADEVVPNSLETYSSSVIDGGYEIDVLSQFKANLQQLEDLNSRLRFVLTEVSGLLKHR